MNTIAIIQMDTITSTWGRSLKRLMPFSLDHTDIAFLLKSLTFWKFFARLLQMRTNKVKRAHTFYFSGSHIKSSFFIAYARNLKRTQVQLKNF